MLREHFGVFFHPLHLLWPKVAPIFWVLETPLFITQQRKLAERSNAIDMLAFHWRSLNWWHHVIRPYRAQIRNGLECCQLNKADLQSLDFSSNRLFMNLFRTGSIDGVKECRSYFGIELPSCLIKKRQDKFLSRLNSVDNVFCRYCCKLWFFVLLCSELISFSLFLITLYTVYHWCWWIKLINNLHKILKETWLASWNASSEKLYIYKSKSRSRGHHKAVRLFVPSISITLEKQSQKMREINLDLMFRVYVAHILISRGQMSSSTVCH